MAEVKIPKRMKCPECGRRIFPSSITDSGWTHVRPMTARERATFHRDGRDPRPDVSCRWTD